LGFESAGQDCFVYHTEVRTYIIQKGIIKMFLNKSLGSARLDGREGPFAASLSATNSNEFTRLSRF